MPQALAHDDPETLGHYRLVARLGTGGMGTVYLGRSPRGRTVALKTMHPHIASEAEFRTRFRLEVDAARVIGDQYGAEVVDADPLAETPWLATEYVLGPSLEEAVSIAGPLSEACVRALGAALCEALAQLHRSDVVHRDLKPSNILITAAGPKLIDFGIARAIGDERLTRTGAAAGTPAFMSPEQATGQEHGASGDVFALAGVLVFAVTGSGPFGQGQPADLLYRVRYGEADLTGVPEGLAPLFQWCFAKEPSCRPGTGQLAAALVPEGGDFSEVLPPPVLVDIAARCARACQPPPPRTLPEPRQGEVEPAESPARGSGAFSNRRRVLSYSAGGAVALAASGSGLWFWRSSGEESGTPAGRPSRAVGEPPEPLWQTSVPEVSPRDALYAAGDLTLVSTEAGYVGVVAESGGVRWTSGKEFRGPNAMVTDGQRIVGNFGFGQASISRVNPASGTIGREILSERAIDDARLLTATSDALYVTAEVKKGKEAGYHCLFRFDPTSGRESWRRRIGKNVGVEVREFVPTVTGKYLVLAYDEVIRVVDVHTGEELWKRRVSREKIPDPLAARESLAVSRTHVYAGFEELFALRLRDGKVDWRFGEGRNKGRFSKYDRIYGPPTVDSGTVYVAERGRGLLAIDAASGKLRWLAKQEGQQVPSNFSPLVGKEYIYYTVDDSRWIVAVDRKKHTAVWTFTGLAAGGTGRSAILHPGSGNIIIGSGTVVTALPLE